MPRLMICPSLSSRPARAPIVCFASAIELLLTQDAVVDVGAHHRVYEDAGRVDGVGVELAERVEVLDLGDHVVGAGGGRHVEVARRAAVDEVCLLYTSPSPRDRTRYRMPS